MNVLVNPGHSASDPGAIGPTGLTEAAVALHVAHGLLARSGAGMVYRGRRQEPGAQGLGRLLTALMAEEPEVVVSLHCNAHATAWTPGRCIHRCDVYWWTGHASVTHRRDSQRLAGVIAGYSAAQNPASPMQPGFAASGMVCTAPIARRRADGGIEHLVPGILRRGRRAAVLVEMGFITDPHVETAMRSVDWVRRAAAALDRALRAYAGEG